MRREVQAQRRLSIDCGIDDVVDASVHVASDGGAEANWVDLRAFQVRPLHDFALAIGVPDLAHLPCKSAHKIRCDVLRSYESSLMPPLGTMVSVSLLGVSRQASFP